MWKTAKSLLSSKKAMMAILSGTVWLVGKAGLELDTEELAGAVAPLWAYIFAQGLADYGKGKEQHKTEEKKAAAEKAEKPEPSEDKPA
jgi:hypothetical protein